MLRKCGPFSDLDVAATIDLIGRDGLFVGPRFMRGRMDLSRLVLFVDQEGSMACFHRLVRDFIQSAEGCDFGSFEVYYFHDWFLSEVFLRETLQEARRIDAVLGRKGLGARVIIISDAGAARPCLDVDFRVKVVARMLKGIRAYSDTAVWVNPLPRLRWRGTSAEAIATMIQMFPMSFDGLIGATSSLIKGRG
jgi:uncharacterized protein with von Willebrand factor type A (vWA) domain